VPGSARRPAANLTAQVGPPSSANAFFHGLVQKASLVAVSLVPLPERSQSRSFRYAATLVKRALTQVFYPLGWSARSALPYCDRARDLAVIIAIPEPPWTPCRQAPTPAPLAHEAKERLREIVEGFFFRKFRNEDGKPTRRLLVKSRPGAGEDETSDRMANRYRESAGSRLLLGDVNEAGIPAQTST